METNRVKVEKAIAHLERRSAEADRTADVLLEKYLDSQAAEALGRSKAFASAARYLRRMFAPKARTRSGSASE